MKRNILIPLASALCLTACAGGGGYYAGYSYYDDPFYDRGTTASVTAFTIPKRTSISMSIAPIASALPTLRIGRTGRFHRPARAQIGRAVHQAASIVHLDPPGAEGLGGGGRSFGGGGGRRR